MFVCWHNMRGCSLYTHEIFPSLFHTDTNAHKSNKQTAIHFHNLIQTCLWRLLFKRQTICLQLGQVSHTCSGFQWYEWLSGLWRCVGVGHLTCGDCDEESRPMSHAWLEYKHWGDGSTFSDVGTLCLPLGWAKLLKHTWLTLLHKNNGPTLSHRSALIISIAT